MAQLERSVLASHLAPMCGLAFRAVLVVIPTPECDFPVRRRNRSDRIVQGALRRNGGASCDCLGIPRRSHFSAAPIGPKDRSDSSAHSSRAASSKLVASARGHCSRRRSAHHATQVTSMPIRLTPKDTTHGAYVFPGAVG